MRLIFILTIISCITSYGCTQSTPDIQGHNPPVKEKQFEQEREATSIPPENMVFVKGGTFLMGSEYNINEKPVHKVTVKDFHIARFETTVKEFKAFVKATNYQTDAEKGDGSYIYNGDSWVKIDSVSWRHNAKAQLHQVKALDYPVVHVSWNDAIAYCNWLSEHNGYEQVYKVSSDDVTVDWSANGYRLLTEAEWEFAASGRGQDKWAGSSSGKEMHSYANFCNRDCSFSWKSEAYKDGYAFASPVGKFKANSAGIYDMSGNAWEWCWDFYKRNFYQSSPTDNPRGPDEGSTRVQRGGSWHSSLENIRCAIRSNYGEDVRSGIVGFRISRNAE